jgi:hypothetical protein
VNFQPALAQLVLSGQKTVTRRLVSDNPRSPWWRDGCALKPGRDYAIQPGRGKTAIGRAEVVSVRRERLGDVDHAEACAEGFADQPEFARAFAAINGWYHKDAEVWRVELRPLREQRS